MLPPEEVAAFAANLEAMSDAEWNANKDKMRECIDKYKGDTGDQYREAFEAEEAQRPRE